MFFLSHHKFSNFILTSILFWSIIELDINQISFLDIISMSIFLSQTTALLPTFRPRQVTQNNSAVILSTHIKQERYSQNTALLSVFRERMPEILYFAVSPTHSRRSVPFVSRRQGSQFRGMENFSARNIRLLPYKGNPSHPVFTPSLKTPYT